MECKHLCDCVKLEKEAVKNKRNEVLVLTTPQPPPTAAAVTNNSNSRTWKCTGKKFRFLCVASWLLPQNALLGSTRLTPI